uniref:Uncharacterized protein n=1 Tax=Anguilla anguilla TaxID=7936 RepID=A0A0E9SHU3_ANGAN
MGMKQRRKMDAVDCDHEARDRAGVISRTQGRGNRPEQPVNSGRESSRSPGKKNRKDQVRHYKIVNTLSKCSLCAKQPTLNTWLEAPSSYYTM